MSETRTRLLSAQKSSSPSGRSLKPSSPNTAKIPAVRQSLPGGMKSHFGLSADPFHLELNNLENTVKVKESEIENLQLENKSLKQLVISKDKAIEDLRADLSKLQDRHLASEKLLSDKILELKSSNDQKKAAFASQAAAEAVMRRLHATVKEKPEPAHEEMIAALEAELKLAMNDVFKLTEDNKAQERNLRVKESALLKAEQNMVLANEKAGQVEILQNLNTKLEKQVDICEEENKTLDRMYQQKVEEVKVLSGKVSGLEESLTVAGGAVSTIKEYQKQVEDLQTALKLSQEELARAKVAVNRVAAVVANEWKDENDRVVPMKTMLEERRHFQKEAQSLRERLALAEKSSKYESQMKEKFHSRLKVIEEGLKAGLSQRDLSRRLSSGGTPTRTSKSLTPGTPPASKALSPALTRGAGELKPVTSPNPDREEMEDSVPAALYGFLEKEVVGLRKTGAEKDQALKDKEDAIEMLSKKVELLSKALDTETKKSKREMAQLQREMAVLRDEGSPDLKKRLSSPRISSPIPGSVGKRSSLSKGEL